MDICVIGAGYVGLVTSACLAYFGNHVIAVDADTKRLAKLKNKQIPFYEPGLSELVMHVCNEGKLEFSSDIDDSVKKSEIIFIAVGTPSAEDGEPDLSQVVSAAKTIGASLDTRCKRIIVNKSTVPVGSGNWVEMLVAQGFQSAQKVPAHITKSNMPVCAVVSNPEFLREGSAIFDTLYPDRIVVGAVDEWAIEKMRLLYKPILLQDFVPLEFVPNSESTKDVPFIVTDLASAEMIKYSANAFLAMKISFANEIATICEKVGADIIQVMQGVGLDKRIGNRFLNAGIGWGGSCFGKDTRALISVANEYNCQMPMLEATISVNKKQRLHIISKLQQELKVIKGRSIGLLGLSFKPNTDDLRDAPSLTIATQLIKMGAEVKAYDPVSIDICAANNPELDIIYCRTMQELAVACDALILVTEWDEFHHCDWREITSLMRNPLMIDGRNFLSRQLLADAGFTYRGVGR